MESSRLEGNFILAPQPWTFPENTNRSLSRTVSVYLLFFHHSLLLRPLWTGHGLKPALSSKYFLIDAISSEDNQYFSWQRVIVIHQSRAQDYNLKSVCSLNFGWTRIKGHIYTSTACFFFIPHHCPTVAVLVYAQLKLHTLFPESAKGP